MIVSRMIGGLGNQMFEYACGLAVAKHHRVPLFLDTRGFNHQQSRTFTLSNFSISGSILEEHQLPTVAQVRSPLVRLLPAWYRPKGLRVYRDYIKTFDTHLTEVGNNMYLDGYWQDERYFVAAAEEVRQEFKLRQPLDPENKRWSDEIASKNSVSLHIRRGDYVNNALYASCSIIYYQLALEHIAKQFPDITVYVFSDDPAWVKDNLKTSFPTSYMTHNGPAKDYLDLVLMSHCRHHIIANSSFSWWGAWLGKHENGIVIAPKTWYNDSSFQAGHILPSSWIAMANTTL